MPYDRFSAINVMTYLEKRYLVQLLQLVVMPHYLTFYNLGYKKKSYVSWYHAKISCLTGRWTLFEFMLFHLAATRTFWHWDLAHFDCFPLVHNKVRLFLFWMIYDILSTSSSAVAIPYMLWLRCFRLSASISYDSQQRGLKVLYFKPQK